MVPSSGVVHAESARWELKRLVQQRRSAEPMMLIRLIYAESCVIRNVPITQEHLCCCCMRREAELSDARH